MNYLSLLFAILGVLIAIAMFAFNLPPFSDIFCKYETVCVLNLSDRWSKWEFDCDIIYSRLGKFWNKDSDYSYGSMYHIELTACSDEVLSILENKFNISLPRDKCHFTCCATDGTCINGRAVNVQGYWWD
ncbi:MAG: hypothetical protein ACTSYM_00415 [Candidatus Baldrarchaeia archaeon]